MAYTAAIITVSDKGARGERTDTAGPALARMLRDEKYEVVYTAIVPDEPEDIRRQLVKCADEQKVHLILTTGGTGFSPRDITPEVTRSVIEREAPGLAELMRAESMKITPRGCLSRSAAGIRGRSLIINLPGSEKGAGENLSAVLKPLSHGLKMLLSEGSADCAGTVEREAVPSMDEWLREAKQDKDAPLCGMYLFHTGVVRVTAKAEVRENKSSPAVKKLLLSVDREKLRAAEERARGLTGIHYVRIWVNEGELSVGDTIMLALVGGDIRDNVVAGLTAFVKDVKTGCVKEKEIY
ncbi:MAG: molybdopterin-binding protein [Selenomonadaceae bacterium]|nr:molybdopterin-binding protein [Selenomonadaceae bacterium]